jgi:hypothetical protein
MQLQPAAFPCPTHQIDLTDLVHEELEDAGFTVAYGIQLGRRPRSRPFEVRVTCPGPDPQSSHPLVFEGTYQ